MDWNFTPPPPSDMTDHGVSEVGFHLKDKRIALLITGSISAYRTPDLVRSMRREGAEVIVFSTKEGLQYVSKNSLEWTSLNKVIDSFTADAEHLSDSTPFDAYLVAPATYNVINKAAMGAADSVVTSTLASALGKMESQQTSILIAPAMHGSMHNSILTESLKKLDAMGVRIIPPRQENGKNNLPSIEILVAETIRSINRQPLKGKDILITGGATPVYLDKIRYLTNHFTGSLAIHIANEAYFNGANVHLILGKGSLIPPPYLNSEVIQNYGEYVETIENLLTTHPISVGIFSAAVADYKPKEIYNGKISSGQNMSLDLLPTEKVIKKVRTQFPDLFMITFKYEENVTHEELINIAQKRLDEGFPLVIANRGDEKGPHNEQIAWFVEKDQPIESSIGKPQIAQSIIQRLVEKL